MPKYEVLIHAHGLTLLDEEGVPQEGGAYIWKVVEANDEEAAFSRAKEALLRDTMFLDELWGSSVEGIDMELDEINEFPEDIDSNGTAPVFYIGEPE